MLAEDEEHFWKSATPPNEMAIAEADHRTFDEIASEVSINFPNAIKPKSC